MRLSSLRPSYLVPRLRQIAFVRSYPRAPWLTQAAVLLLESWLQPDDFVVEWGSGRSTAWFAERTARVLSVEANPAWYARVAESLAARKLDARVDQRLIPCQLGEFDEPIEHPYFGVASELADGSVDFALVDGNLRLRCIESIMPKIRPGGLLGLDNANRFVPNRWGPGHSTVHEPRSAPVSPGWARVLEELRGWRSILTSDGIWDTRFWVRPATERAVDA